MRSKKKQYRSARYRRRPLDRDAKRKWTVRSIEGHTVQKVEDLAASRSEKSKPVSAFGATTRPPRRFTWPENFGKKFSRYHRRFRLRFLIATRWKPWKRSGFHSSWERPRCRGRSLDENLGYVHFHFFLSVVCSRTTQVHL